MPQVVVENLTKTFRIAERSPGLWGAFKALADRKYRVLTALDRISFSLEKGEILGYIGPNGAGKSTTVKILSGMVPVVSADNRINFPSRHIANLAIRRTSLPLNRKLIFIIFSNSQACQEAFHHRETSQAISRTRASHPRSSRFGYMPRLAYQHY
jgi:ABC-type multidrug transport system ATPase subunit